MSVSLMGGPQLEKGRLFKNGTRVARLEERVRLLVRMRAT